MFTSTFTFKKRQFDEAFHTLDNAIAEIARTIPGYLGEEAWENASTGLISTVYYWRTREGLQELIAHPGHIEAKQRQSQWLDGYHVVIAEVIGSYGDGKLPHPLAATREPPEPGTVTNPGENA